MNEKSPLITFGFQGLGISPKILEILDQLHFKQPTPIQHQVIPVAMEGKDIVGVAQTGTGKTLAFGIPMIQRIAINHCQGLVVLPTRELALQVDEMLQKIGRSLGLRTAVLIGGASMNLQIQSLRRNPNIIIATPGRLADHLQQGTVKLDNVKIVVIDEADRMFDVGFAPQINKILSRAPKNRQTMLFSATLSPDVVHLARAHLSIPLRIEVAPSGTAPTKVEQEFFIVSKDQKLQLLEKMLTDYNGIVLVFARTKHGVRKITTAIKHMGHTSAEIHSNRSLPQRREALAGFKLGRYRVLVATDIAARGIDVVGIELVINFDLPDNTDDYVHRIGRTGRAGYAGRAISFATPDQRGDIRSIEKLIRRSVPIKALPTLPPKRTPPVAHNLSSNYHRPRRSFISGRSNYRSRR
ncbi:MAG: DEAD/DEAH box helicase [Patescibacteria group bacterium]|nr:DEAD/DEAH box helicase [Patescibacteria group bacterium]MDD5120981.1 DEAD/DEAH box helicase [Patescibacteria group bacterium]MDD5222263.1 DEAD/DEAH box helicase [Patescibacteria group bacterium]MDD5396424.1 DEAD/DEAH box helicase [Patescibacteria group bacterium]